MADHRDTAPGDHFDALLADFFDGDMDAPRAAQLTRMLRADPARAALFVDLFRQSSTLGPILAADDPSFARAVMEAAKAHESAGSVVFGQDAGQVAAPGTKSRPGK